MGFKQFISEEDGVGTVEVVLILVVIVALVVIFRKEIKGIVEKALKKVQSDSDTVISE
ncbi:MAG: Flp1 family type IVb pilin [Candidatus Weimeria sp.]